MNTATPRHVYPGVNLLDWGGANSEVVNYTMHSIEHFRDNINISENGNPYGYLTMWNGMVNGFDGHHHPSSMRDIIETMDDARRFWAVTDRWSNFDAIIYGPVGHGGKHGETGSNPVWIDYPIEDYVNSTTIELTGVVTYEFDPAHNNYGKFRIYDPNDDDEPIYEDLVIDFGMGPFPDWPEILQNPTRTTIVFDGTPNLQDDSELENWVMRRPQKTITQWLDWFDALLTIIDETLARN